MTYGANDYLVRVVMTAASGLPQDQIVNDFAFRRSAGTVGTTELEQIMARVANFYRSGATEVEKVGAYIGSQVDRGATHLMQAFHIVAGPLGSPTHEVDWLGPVAPLSGDNLPTEVAGVLSFHANLTGIQEELGATRPRARRRGRVYIGPLVVEAIDMTVDAPILSTPFRTALASAATRLYDEAQGVGWDWSVWSRADQALRIVTGGWTDDAPDSQRRRGQAPANRATWTA